MIYSRCLEEGVDITKDRIPVFPCQHYLMGGINVDLDAKTSIDGLYAAGECAHTGVHGINRLASNSLLEALVFSRLIAENINETTAPVQDYSPVEHPFRAPEGEPLPTGLRTEIRHIMQKAYFVVPDIEEAKRSIGRVREIKELLEKGNYALTPDYVEALSIATCAYIVLSEII